MNRGFELECEQAVYRSRKQFRQFGELRSINEEGADESVSASKHRLVSTARCGQQILDIPDKEKDGWWTANSGTRMVKKDSQQIDDGQFGVGGWA